MITPARTGAITTVRKRKALSSDFFSRNGSGMGKARGGENGSRAAWQHRHAQIIGDFPGGAFERAQSGRSPPRYCGTAAHATSRRKTMYKHILVPTDGTALSLKAARAAAKLATKLKARITA